MASAIDGERFVLKLPGYFVEQQGGRKLDLTLDYAYSGVLPLDQMPDYRLIQLLVEDVLYKYDASFVDIFWEMQNRELVRRVLHTFSQISRVRCEIKVYPSELMVIERTSVAEWSQKELPSLGPGYADFEASYRQILGESTDSFWYPAPGEKTFNIGAPRALMPSLQHLFRAIKIAPAADNDVVSSLWLSFAPVQLQALEGTYDELIRVTEQCGSYDALVLPRCCAHQMARSITVGKLTGIVEVKQKDDTAVSPHLPCVMETSLGTLLGSPSKCELASLEDSRAGFFVAPPKYGSMVVEKAFESAFTSRGYKTDPVFDGEPLELCFSSTKSGGVRQEEALRLLQSLLDRLTS